MAFVPMISCGSLGVRFGFRVSIFVILYFANFAILKSVTYPRSSAVLLGGVLFVLNFAEWAYRPSPSLALRVSV